MQSKVLSFRTIEGALGKAAYIADANDPRHQEKIVESHWIGCSREEEFALELVSVLHGDGKIRRGPKVRVCAWEFEARTPFLAYLNRAEIELIHNRVASGMGIVKGRLGIHIDRNQKPPAPEPNGVDPKKELKIGSTDFHLIACNQDAQGSPLSKRILGNLRIRFRKLMDKIHDEINELRRAAQRPHIPTMQQVRREQRYFGRKTLVEKIAATAIRLKADDIISFLRREKMLGRRGCVQRKAGCHVSIVYAEGRSGRLEPLDELIRDIRQEHEKLIRAKKVTVQSEKMKTLEQKIQKEKIA